LGILHTSNVTEKKFNLPSVEARECLNPSGPTTCVSPHLFCLCTEIHPLSKTVCYFFLFLIPYTAHIIKTHLMNLIRRVWFSLNDYIQELISKVLDTENKMTVEMACKEVTV
jgi:hypothetical protein